MQRVEFNYIKYIFPFSFNSKFLIIRNNEQPFIRNIELSLNLKNQAKPEILFWFLFRLNNKKNFLHFFFKKKYNSGKSFVTRSFINLSKNFGSKKNIIYFLHNIYHDLLEDSKEISMFKTFPKCKKIYLKAFKIQELNFNETYNGLINLAPKNWKSWKINLIIKPYSINGYHFRFFLQNMQLPVI